jgi:citrate/tricarballylate utilization protein
VAATSRVTIDALIRQGAHAMTVCNACRYCEQYCPVFPAMEERTTFPRADLFYLSNLCHNCGECLYACQYAPPHEFGINVPHTLAQIRLRSYEEYAWPRALGGAFARHNLLTGLALAAGFSAIVAIAAAVVSPGALSRADGSADFYAVVPHGVMVAVFGSVFAFAVLAMIIGLMRFVRDVGTELGTEMGTYSHPNSVPNSVPNFFDALTLRHLHTSGADCVSAEEARAPWRRRMHHCTFYGFLLCAASTSVAAIYHSVFGWLAPYAYASLPVVLGTIGGVGLVVGSLGLWILRRRRDPDLGDAAQQGMDESFLALLFLTSITGLALLVLRHQPVMPALLVVHLGTVLALFVTLPYGKFVHGLYRVAALIVGRKTP